MRRAAATLVFAFLLLVPTSFAEEHQHSTAGAKDGHATASAIGRRRAVRKPSSDRPIARNDSFSVARGGTLTRAANDGVLANDADPKGRPITAVLVLGPSQGQLGLNADGSFTYVHNATPGASDSFTYKAVTATIESTPATATITITDPAPLAVNDAYPASTGTTLTIPAPGVLANDTRNNGSIASYGASGAEQTTPGNATPTSQGGTIRLDADGGFTYDAGTGFSGADAFKYVLANSGGSSTAQVEVTVLPPPPTATNDAYSTPQNTPLVVSAPGVLENDVLRGATITSFGASSGAEQQALGATTPTTNGGSVRLNANGSFTYTPTSSFTGGDTFKYVVGNAGGSATATVTITVQASNEVDFVVTSPGFFFVFSGVSGTNPVLTLTRGRTYRFRIQTSVVHPFEILDAPPGSVTNNGISNGILTFAVPASANNYEYWCPIHDFGNDINTVP